MKRTRTRSSFLFPVFLLLAFGQTAFAFSTDYSRIEGLQAPANVTRDTDGIAHIRALNEHDMFFLQGYVHAQDRLFQMDLNRRQPSGTLAEVLGEGALSSDVELRTIGLRRAAQRSLAAIEAAAANGDEVSQGSLNALNAYAKGVNAFLSEGQPLPPEYQALGIQAVEPWTPLDSLTIGKLIAFGLSFDLDDIDNTINLQAFMTALGPQTGQALYFNDLYRSQPFDSASTVPDSGGSAQGQGSSQPLAMSGLLQKKGGKIAAQAQRYLARAEAVPLLNKFIEQDRTSLGSNEWGVTGSVSKNGFPIIANDPHLALDHPSTFYPMQIRSPGYNAMGSGFAGAPFVIVGKNRHIAWGPTTNPMDVTDVFFDSVVVDAESPSGLSIALPGGQMGHIVPVPESYRVNADINGDGQPDGVVVPVPPNPSIPAATLTVPDRYNGVILDFDQTDMTALTVQYTGFGATRELETFYVWNQARNLEEFKDGLSRFDFGSQNWSYTDRKGNLAYFASAEMPVRTDLELLGAPAGGVAPYFIRQGDLDLHQWLPASNQYPNQSLPYEIYAPNEMPQVVNPVNGFFVNANNDPAGTTLDNDPLNQFRATGGVFYLNPGYAQGFRAGRITKRLERLLETGDRKVSVHEMQAIQADVGLLDAEYFVPRILAAYEASQAENANPDLEAAGSDSRFADVMAQMANWMTLDYQAKTGIPEGYDSEDQNGDPAGSLDSEEILASRATAVYSMWRTQMLKGTIDATLQSIGLGGFSPGSAQAMTALKNLVDNGGQSASGLDFFSAQSGDQATDVQIGLLTALGAALDRFESAEFAAAFNACTGSASDYRWGCLHRIVFDSPLGQPFSVPNAFGFFEQPFGSLPGIPTDGGFGVVDASSHSARADGVNSFMYSSGATNRLVVEGRRFNLKAESVWPSGVSAVPGNEFYIYPMLPNWLSNDAQPLRFTTLELLFGLHSSEFYFPAR